MFSFNVSKNQQNSKAQCHHGCLHCRKGLPVLDRRLLIIFTDSNCVSIQTMRDQWKPTPQGSLKVASLQQNHRFGHFTSSPSSLLLFNDADGERQTARSLFFLLRVMHIAVGASKQQCSVQLLAGDDRVKGYRVLQSDWGYFGMDLFLFSFL